LFERISTHQEQQSTSASLQRMQWGGMQCSFRFQKMCIN